MDHATVPFLVGFFNRGDFVNLWAFAILTLAVAIIIVVLAGPEHLSRRNKRNVLEPEVSSPGRVLQPAQGVQL